MNFAACEESHRTLRLLSLNAISLIDPMMSAIAILQQLANEPIEEGDGPPLRK